MLAESCPLLWHCRQFDAADLVNDALSHRAAKRVGPRVKITLDEVVSVAKQQDMDLVALDEALSRLATLDSQQSRVVELRFFGGLTIEETAEVLRISPAIVKREWANAKAWLHCSLTKGSGWNSDE